MSDLSYDDEYISLPGSFRYDHASDAYPATSFGTYSRDDDEFYASSAFPRNSRQRFGGRPSSRSSSIADSAFQQDYHSGRTFPMNEPGPSRANMPFPSFFGETQQVRPFPPPRMDMALVQRQPNSIDWVSKLNLWDQAQKIRTESKYEYRLLDNGEHVAQVNVGGSGRIFQGIAKKKGQAKQQAAMGACEALRLRVG